MDICVEGKAGCWQLINMENGRLLHSYEKLVTAVNKAKKYGGKVYIKDIAINKTCVIRK